MVVVVVVVSAAAQNLPPSWAAPSLMQWMWRCCLHIALLIATCEKGLSESVAMPALTACNWKRETKHCVREGRWPCHPLVTEAAAQANLEQLALQLGLHGISVGEVRELGLWIYLKSNEVSDPRVCSEARSILDTKLEEAFVVFPKNAS